MFMFGGKSFTECRAPENQYVEGEEMNSLIVNDYLGFFYTSNFQFKSGEHRAVNPKHFFTSKYQFTRRE